MNIDWDAIVKTYDVRGLVGKSLTSEIVAALAAGFVDELGAAGKDVVVGHDMRDSSPEFADAFAAGAQARGANVVSIGLCSTDESYFASGVLDAPAAMFTASHNPAAYNGIKFSRAGARGISMDTGLAAIRDRAKVYIENGIDEVATPGGYRDLHILVQYASYLRELVDLSGIRPLKVVVDAANGMGGMTVPAVLGHASDLEALPLEIIPMYFELDGTFPNHEANPLDPKNLVDLQTAVVEHGADIGLAFDGDADRCFVIDEKGNAVTPSAVAAIVAHREIDREKRTNPGAPITVLHNLLIGRHTHRATGLWQDLFFTAKARETELRSREKVEEVIELLDLQHALMLEWHLPDLLVRITDDHANKVTMATPMTTGTKTDETWSTKR